MSKLFILPICLLAALAIACSGDTESAPSSTTPASKPESTATRPPATATIAATATPEPPTATPEPPPPEPPTPEPPTPEPAPPNSRPPFNNGPPGGPGPGPGPGPGGPPGGPTSATITASGLDFQTKVINARAGASVTVTLNNQDTLVPHDLTISGLAAIPSCTGPCSNSVAFTAPGPGNYPFLCTIHPDMTGTLRVAP